VRCSAGRETDRQWAWFVPCSMWKARLEVCVWEGMYRWEALCVQKGMQPATHRWKDMGEVVVQKKKRRTEGDKGNG